MAKEEALQKALFAMRDAIDGYRTQTGRCPESLAALEGSYIRTLPIDPLTKSKTWHYVQRPIDDRRICDVKSTADGNARDGSRYSDW